MKKLLLIVPMLVGATALLAAGGCEDDDAAQVHATPDGVAQGYDPRAAPGTQAPDGNTQAMTDEARPAAADVPAEAQDSPQGTRILSDVDRRFLLDAVRANAAELKLAKLAQDKASRPEVRDYAKTILDEHLKTNQQLMAQATRQNVDLKEQPGNESDRAADAMKDLSGEAFERAYLQHEIRAHEQAIAKYRDAATKVKDPEVLSLINQTLPALERHLEAARGLTQGAASP